MNIVQTALVFVGIPLGLTLVLAVAVFGKTAVNQNRYRPGRPWTHPPVWYLPHPAGSEPHRPAPPVRALPAGSPRVHADERMGGASGEW